MNALSDYLFSFVNAHWLDAKDLFNSVFFTAIAGSLAGAFAGPRSAQKIAEKARNKEELLKEIRNTNAATMIAVSIWNSLVEAKKQHIKSLKNQFDRQRALAQEALARQQAGQGGAYDFHADFRTLPILNLPLAILQAQIFEKLSLHGRPIVLTTTLIQSVDGLNTAIIKRNQLVEFYKASSLMPNQLLELYFGFRHNGGLLNQEYPDSMEAIYRKADDGIFFSAQLCNELSEHGDKISAAFKKQFGKGSPRIIKPDFSKIKEADLMPNDDNYSTWFSMFVKREDRSREGAMQFIWRRLLRANTH
jgi:hypothetical protein